MTDKKRPGCCGEDVVFMGPPTGKGGARPYVRHCSDCTTQVGTLKPVGEGEPLHDGAILLEQRPAEPGVYDVRGRYRASKSGPPKVTTPEYRDNYVRIFGGSQPVGQA